MRRGRQQVFSIYVISNDAALTGKIVNSVTVTATSVSESTVLVM